MRHFTYAFYVTTYKTQDATNECIIRSILAYKKMAFQADICSTYIKQTPLAVFDISATKNHASAIGRRYSGG